jgi:predicted nucleic acid-binding protein
MLLISDNSPLSALAEIGLLDLIPQLYGSASIPMSVYEEARHSGAPEALRAWIANPPSWLAIVPDPVLLPETLGLDSGESAAISLAWLHRPNVLLIIDERDARELCKALGLPLTGTVGLLLDAALVGLIDFEQAISKLQATSFRISSKILELLRAKLPKR